MKKIFEITITKDNPIIKNHVVNNNNVLPGLAYIDMIFQVAKNLSLDFDKYELKYLSIFNPLIVKEDPVKLEVTVIKAKDYWDIKVEGEKEKNITYITAQLHKNTIEAVDTIEINKIKKDSKETLDVEVIYKSSRERGLVHKGIIKPDGLIYLTDFGCLCELNINKEYEELSETYIFNPTLIDGAGMACGILHAENDNVNDLYIPLYYEGFTCKEKLTNSCYIIAEKASLVYVNDIRKMNIKFFNKSGKFIGELKGMTSKKIRTQNQLSTDKTANLSAKNNKLDKGSNKEIKQDNKKEIKDESIGLRKHEIRDALKELFSKHIEIGKLSIDDNVGFFELGLSSLELLNVVKELESFYNIKLSPTLLFECSTLSDLTDYLYDNLDIYKEDEIEVVEKNVELKDSINEECRNASDTIVRNENSDDDIAIIGISAKFPKSDDVYQYWSNLKNSIDCVTEIPKKRWDWERFDKIKSSSGKGISKFGGFIDGFDCFDPMFFRISPREAENIDPQERLFLQGCWEVIEDAGYTPETLVDGVGKNNRRKVGVYVGTMHKDYSLIGLENILAGNLVPLSLNYAPIANRISYFFNFHGPSMVIDTVCSSSLVSVDLAMKSIKDGECDVALAGGVNLSMHWGKYLTYGLAGMHSYKGYCNTFGKDADGYVSSDGVGVVLLKPLKKAVKDKDHIYAVIKGCAVNHGGAASGMTVPNPVAQAEVITSAIEKSKVDPRTINYMEAHGTGTSLGDPIELKGLTKAYNKYTKDKQFCAIGSVKSNIGHAESAAGVSGLIKVALQLKNKILVSSIHAEEINPLLNFKDSPFYIQRTTEEWKRVSLVKDNKAIEYPLRAGISSFGATGTNAHIILEEYIDKEIYSDEKLEAVLIPISARNKECLKEYIKKMIVYIKKQEIEAEKDRKFNLLNMAYTLQVGRIEMDERVVFVVKDIKELTDVMEYYLNDECICNKCYEGKVNNTGATRCNMKSIA